MELIFTRYNKYVYNKYNKKQSDEYILNIDKLMKSKLDENISVLNVYQTFILDYEIIRLLSKIIGKTYNKIVYVNQNLSVTYILNMISLLEKKYPDETFKYTIYYDEDDLGIVDTVSKERDFDKKLVAPFQMSIF